MGDHRNDTYGEPFPFGGHLTMAISDLLDKWLRERQLFHGGECTQSEWEHFLIMRRRIFTWRRELLVRYHKYLLKLPAGGNIVLDRPRLYMIPLSEYK